MRYLYSRMLQHENWLSTAVCTAEAGANPPWNKYNTCFTIQPQHRYVTTVISSTCRFMQWGPISKEIQYGQKPTLVT